MKSRQQSLGSVTGTRNKCGSQMDECGLCSQVSHNSPGKGCNLISQSRILGSVWVFTSRISLIGIDNGYLHWTT